MALEGDILIIGNGACARSAVRLLVQKGITILMADMQGGQPNCEEIPNDLRAITCFKVGRIASCSGQSGDFKLKFENKEGGATCHVKCILVATDQITRPNFDDYGLKPSDRVRTLSDMESALSGKEAATHFTPGERVLLLNRWHPDSHPNVAARMLKLCLQIQRNASTQTHFVTGNLKVSMQNMERVFQEAKEAGTIFLRASDDFPSFKTLSDGRIRMDYHDEVTRNDFHLTADSVVIDESFRAAPFLGEVGKTLRIECDQDGLLQQDNVHRLCNETNRSGIFVAGAARGFLSNTAMEAEAKLVSIKVSDFLAAMNGNAHSDSEINGKRAPKVEPRVEPNIEPNVKPNVKIDQAACARCLTCYRLCPYGAVDASPRMDIHPVACQACGLCWAGCPNRAIHIDDGKFSETLNALFAIEVGSVKTNAEMSNILVYCCKRSAAQARNMALCMGYRLPPGMVFVEGFCGGTLSVNDLLRSFEAGADGVMVLTCHEGNCHSESGTRFARKRVLEASRSLSLAGIAEERIHYSTLASNMTHAFVQQTGAFAKKIGAMGQVLPL